MYTNDPHYTLHVNGTLASTQGARLFGTTQMDTAVATYMLASNLSASNVVAERAIVDYVISDNVDASTVVVDNIFINDYLTVATKGHLWGPN